jgi:uncharacterized repeat protein (TIGR01451 family)
MLPDDLPGSGNILVFDNGMANIWSIVPHRAYSRVIEIDPVTNSYPYTYTAESSGYPKETFLSDFMSGAERQSNGNTLIVEATWGRIFEITDSGQIVWEYMNPYADANNTTTPIYRAYKVPLDWAGPHFVPDLVVSVDADPDPVQVGSDLSYTIQVENVGWEPAINVQLADTTPIGTTFQSVSAPSGWECSTPAIGGTGAITCTVSNLSAGSSAFLTIVVKVDLCDVDGTTITNTLTVSSLGSDANPGDNASTIHTTGASDTVIQDLVVSLINDGEDVQLDWGDWAPACGYRVVRSTTPDGGFLETSGSISSNNYTDSGAGSSPESYYYLVRID